MFIPFSFFHLLQILFSFAFSSLYQFYWNLSNTMTYLNNFIIIVIKRNEKKKKYLCVIKFVNKNDWWIVYWTDLRKENAKFLMKLTKLSEWKQNKNEEKEAEEDLDKYHKNFDKTTTFLILLSRYFLKKSVMKNAFF